MKETSVINFGNETLYTIDTNGGVIGFDLTDFTNVDRLESMYDKFEKVHKDFKTKQTLTDKRNNQEKNKFDMTAKERETIANFNEFIERASSCIDEFFGKGASEKVFYEPILERKLVTEPRLMMFLDELLPKELEKAGIKQDLYLKKRTSKENRQKFVKKDEDIKELD